MTAHESITNLAAASPRSAAGAGEGEHGAFGAGAAALSAGAVRELLGSAGAAVADVAIVLGSGLGGLVSHIENPVTIRYADIPGFPAATVEGHTGALVVGRLEGRTVLALAGRFHMYEGHEARLAGFPIRVVHALGARSLVVSNAAGGLRKSFSPGTLMLITDHINLSFRNPLVGPLEPGDVRFPDLSNAYDPALRLLALGVAQREDVTVEEGVYVSLLGPTYETPAEVRMLQLLGGDAVGMSTVPEVIVARAVGMRVLGISCITNMACGLSDQPITHAEVLETTSLVAQRFERLVRGVVRDL